MLAGSVLLAAVAAALLAGPPTRTSTVRVATSTVGGLAVGGGAGSSAARGVRRRLGATTLLATPVAVWSLSSIATGTQLAVGVVAAVSALAVARMVAAARRAQEAARRRRAVVDFCEALVGELRAGQPVLVALERSASVWPEVAPIATAARLDADLPAALRRLSRSPGAESLEHLAAAWQLCAATGGGLTSAATVVLESARADAAALRQVEGEVSSARATAWLVAALPVVVLSAGQGLGGRPWAFLLGRPVGVVCLGCGVALVLAGLTWIDRIAAAATSGEG